MAQTTPARCPASDLGTGSPPDTAQFDVSGYVRRARRLADLSQRDLADRLGVNQATIARVENGGSLDVDAFLRILGVAGLQLCVVGAQGDEVMPMPDDVFRDRAGRRRPAHLDVHALPEVPTMKMLFRSVDPAPDGVWHHLRPERDRLRARTGLTGRDEQLHVRAARARRRRPRGDRVEA